MKNRIDTLFVGATYFAIGYASVHPECVIMESSQTLGGEFHHSLIPVKSGSVGEEDRETALAEMMKQEQVLKDGNLDLLKASLVLHRFVSEQTDRIHILMDARILELEKEKGEYVVKYMDQEGIHQVYCKRVLDTTARRVTSPGDAICKEKFFNLFLVSMTDTMEQKLTAVCPGCIIIDGRNPGEKFVKFPSEAEETVTDAYRRITDLWKKAFPQAKERIMFMAEDFEYTCAEREDADAPCPWMSVKFLNPLTAFAKGAAYRMEERGEEVWNKDSSKLSIGAVSQAGLRYTEV